MWNGIMHTLLVLANYFYPTSPGERSNGRKFKENNHWIWNNVCDSSDSSIVKMSIVEGIWQ